MKNLIICTNDSPELIIANMNTALLSGQLLFSDHSQSMRTGHTLPLNLFSV